MSDDLISRRALYERAATLEAQALDYVGKLIERDGEETSVEWRIWSAILTERTAFKHDVYDAPSAQPEKVCIAKITLSEEQVREAVEKAKSEIVQVFPSTQPEQRWIPVSERLPEEDTDVLISYRYKEGEGDISHVYIDITSYGDMYFGGRKVKGAKHWRQPFEYFTSNYEVIAWMPLPEPWKGEEDV